MADSSSSCKRVRIRKACTACSSRKRKCNGAHPCDACTAYGYTCWYRQDGRGAHPTLDLAGKKRHGNSLKSAGRGSVSPGDANTLQDAQLESSRLKSDDSLEENSYPYVGSHSSISFPRFLGLQLQSQIIPELQPFAWNLEIRDMPPRTARLSICSLISIESARNQVDSFFQSQSPACGFLDQESFLECCKKHWAGENQGLPFEALIGGIIGLASILSPMASRQQEFSIVKHTESILTDHAVIAQPSLELLAATVLRGLYLRATATPHITWLQSCTAMHIAESLGLHENTNSPTRGENILWTAQVQSCLFWTVCAGNRLISHELGRSPVIIQKVTREYPFPLSDTSSSAVLCRLCCTLPIRDISGEPDDEQARLADFLRILQSTTIDQPYLQLVAADVCFCLYRRIRVNRFIVTESQGRSIVLVGRGAVQAANQLIQQGKPWWNLLSTLFQFACTLISLDCLDSLVDLRDTLKAISLVSSHYPGSKIVQALSTLRILIRASKQRKEKQLAYLQAVEESGFGGEEDPQENITEEAFDPFLRSAFPYNEWSTTDYDWMSAWAPITQN
ncbi:hypothetical protein BKA64DRAFT_383101 [Cadophora sp. MPI-SDFR-AT-0126]|nr:hypothetical protein BKA64DRAFT_383101 [Leotiomycetes sp. MPI-SDFR-AT-0126]